MIKDIKIHNWSRNAEGDYIIMDRQIKKLSSMEVKIYQFIKATKF